MAVHSQMPAIIQAASFPVGAPRTTAATAVNACPRMMGESNPTPAAPYFTMNLSVRVKIALSMP